MCLLRTLGSVRLSLWGVSVEWCCGALVGMQDKRSPVRYRWGTGTLWQRERMGTWLHGRWGLTALRAVRGRTRPNAKRAALIATAQRRPVRLWHH